MEVGAAVWIKDRKGAQAWIAGTVHIKVCFIIDLHNICI